MINSSIIGDVSHCPSLPRLTPEGKSNHYPIIIPLLSQILSPYQSPLILGLIPI